MAQNGKVAALIARREFGVREFPSRRSTTRVS